ncbi:hypothetical protein Ddye_025573 [Dipteronia dyeriana]|uniref:Uncharacterized protein n=1 Tax=Dipteronia dyeriana TaxID=168575 RepID=A0AAD9TLF6_9ROSI|nr:hypothetical protein Ddye_025573 [Dipteronia dyeriana]
MVKIILKIPAALRRDDDGLQRDDEPKRTTVDVPRKPRSERKWEKNNKIITKKRISVFISGEAVREKIERIKYSRDYSFLFPVLDDHYHYQPPPLVLPLIKKSKEASKSKVIKTSTTSTSNDHDQLGLLKDDRKVEDNNYEGFR